MHSPADINEIVIPKEQALFWMDRRGRWHNAGGPFRHKKIIDYFNTAIRRDGGGYYVEQLKETVREKVYFRYEDTPLFALEFLDGHPGMLVLNTGGQLALDPQQLFVRQDSLYLQNGDECIKFSERLLLKLTDYIDYEGGRYFFCIHNRRRPIPER